MRKTRLSQKKTPSIESEKTQIQELQAEVQHLSGFGDRQSKEMLKLKIRNQELEKAGSGQQDDIIELGKSLQRSRGESDRLLKRKDHYKNKSVILRNKLINQENKNAELDQDNDILSQTEKGLKINNSALRKENNKLKIAYAKQEKELILLRGKISKKNSVKRPQRECALPSSKRHRLFSATSDQSESTDSQGVTFPFDWV